MLFQHVRSNVILKYDFTRVQGKALDLSGHGNHGTISGAQFVSGYVKGGMCLEFLQNTDRVVIPYTYQVGTGSYFGVMAWVRTTTADIDRHILDGGEDTICLEVKDTGVLEWTMAANYGASTLLGNIAINDGKWHLVGGQVTDNTPNTSRLFVDKDKDTSSGDTKAKESVLDLAIGNHHSQNYSRGVPTFSSNKQEGRNDSVITNVLYDAQATFITNSVAVGDWVNNRDDRTYAQVVSVDSETQLTLDAHIFTATNKYYTVGSLNDMFNGGAYSGTVKKIYRIQIDGTGTPNTFKWSDSDGVTWNITGVAITGGNQTLNENIYVVFDNTTNHTLDTYWRFTCSVYQWIGQIAGLVISRNKKGFSLAEFNEEYFRNSWRFN